jgi:hypothetical protein
MTLAAQMQTDLSVFFNADEHAQAITYNSAAIDAVESFSNLMSKDDGAVKKVKTVWVKVSDVASPAYRDTVVINGITWYVGPEEEHQGDQFVWELPLYRDERPVI